MKISEKQLLMLLDIAKETCSVPDLVGGYDPQQRVQLVNDIINQQSDKPKEMEDSKKKFVRVPAPKNHTLSELTKKPYYPLDRKIWVKMRGLDR